MATVAEPRPISTTGMDGDLAQHIYRTMARIRAADQSIQRSLAAGDLQFQYYPCGGQEAIPAAISPLLRPDDQVVTTYRGIHDIIAKGSPIKEIMAEMFGRATGTCKGKGGPMHLSDPNTGLMVTTGIVGAGAPIANGLALASQLDGTGRVVICNFGDGAANIGAVHEALNLAALWQLPIVFVCQNNLYAEYTSFKDSTRSDSIAGRAAGYGMAGEQVDGTDPVAVHHAAMIAIDRARAGGGPTLLECVAHRLQGHSFGSDEGHMNAAELALAREQVPALRFRSWLLHSKLADAEALERIDREAELEIEEAVAFALASARPEEEELYTDIFEDVNSIPGFAVDLDSPAPDPQFSTSSRLTYGRAINSALGQAMEQDISVILLGEDIADPAGGIVKATAGLSTRFGLERVRATPISEQAIVGAAIGAGLAGLKPVAEIMIVDFAMVCMDQIANHAAKLRYMSGGRTSVPITLRMLTAGNVGSFGAQHSQSLESWFAHIPGLKIVAPSNAMDAKGLLLSCIHDPDPCIFLESMRCYFGSEEVPDGDWRIPLGSARVARVGTDITIISYSWAMQEALAAAEQLEQERISVEVIDLRSIVPLDLATIEKSVRKTGRALILHAAVEFGGFGAELAAQLGERLHSCLKAPIRRLGGRYTPIPFAQNLETLHFPAAHGAVAIVKQMIRP